jgi:hypothetical protein
MQNIRPLVQSKLAADVTAATEVKGAAGLSSVLQGAIVDQGIYCFQERVSPQANDSIGSVAQIAEVIIAVISVIECVSDERGGDAADLSADLQNSIRDSLIGWSPAAGFSSMVYTGGALINFAGGFYIWRDSFSTKTVIQ